MERSDEYIDFKAYTRYLKKVTGEPADPDALKEAVLAKALESTEMHMAYILLRRLTAAAAVLLIIALCSAMYGYFSSESIIDEKEVWTDARMDDRGRNPASRLYEAYKHSNEIREKLL